MNELKGLIQVLRRDIITLYEEQNKCKHIFIHSGKHGRSEFTHTQASVFTIRDLLCYCVYM